MPKKRSFEKLREQILCSFNKEKKTVNQLSTDAGINWRTVDNHLVYLVGKGMVNIVFESPYAKVHELSEKGKEYLEALKT